MTGIYCSRATSAHTLNPCDIVSRTIPRKTMINLLECSLWVKCVCVCLCVNKMTFAVSLLHQFFLEDDILTTPPPVNISNDSVLGSYSPATLHGGDKFYLPVSTPGHQDTKTSECKKQQDNVLVCFSYLRSKSSPSLVSFCFPNIS